ncbi:MAG TPA: hypothetical protein DIT95_21355 [Arenibacter sp.]|nr:hypothetical protein [Arenibacter sp.]
MPFPKIDNHNLLLDIFENINGIPHVCEELTLKNQNEIFYETVIDNPEPTDLHKIYSIKYISGYLQVKYKDETSGKISIKKYGQEKGYAINLSGVSNVDEYIKNKFNSYGKTIRRSVKRLEACFDIKYIMYYGEVEKKHFDFLMETLHQMIIARFKQRNETSENLKDWQWRCKQAYFLIKEKRASLFVIYHGQKAISISLNYNFNKVHFSYISSYDIDYSKFGLGHVDNYKQLEWCLANNFEIFELGWGTLDYKRRWCNYIYLFEHHLVYIKSSFPAQIYTTLIGFKIQLKSFLVSKDVHMYIRNIKNKLIYLKKKEEGNRFRTEIIEKNHTTSLITKIDYNLETYSFLRKNIYDYLYLNTLPISKLTVYKIDTEEAYILTGGKTIQKVAIDKTFESNSRI